MAADPTSETNDLSRRFFREHGLAAEVARLVEPAIEALGFELVRVLISGRNGMTVQIMADRPEGGITITDCETISRDVSALLEAHDPIPGNYHLELSSPGIDRPLVRPRDFENWAGFEAKVELTEPVEGRKRFKGHLDGYEAGELRIAVAPEQLSQIGTEPVVIGLPLTIVEAAKLTMTDELLRETLRRAKAATRAGDTLLEGAETDLGAEATLGDTEATDRAPTRPKKTKPKKPSAPDGDTET